MTEEQAAKIKPGDTIRFNDPQIEYYSRDLVVKSISICGDVVSISDKAGSELECYAAELELPKFEINGWGSNPDAGNDDCYCGLGLFGDRYSALDAFYMMTDRSVGDASIAWVALVQIDEAGDIVAELCSKQIRSDAEMTRQRESEWQEERRERAYEAGMLGGVDSYNEVMGY